MLDKNNLGLTTDDSDLSMGLDSLDQGVSKKINFSEKPTYHRDGKRYDKMAMGMLLLCILFGFIFYVVFYSHKYYKLNARKTELTQDEKIFVENYKQKKAEIYGYVGLKSGLEDAVFSVNLGEGFDKDITNDEIEKYLSNKNVSYLVKRDSFLKFVNEIVGNVKSDREKIDQIRLDIGTYGFLPEEVKNTIKDNYIQRTISSVEAIKFSTALKVLYYLDAFNSRLASISGRSAGSVNQSLKKFIERGEIDTQRYLDICYLNPYETDDCDAIKDFDNFYSLEKDVSSFDAGLFKKAMLTIDDFLNYDNPTISIIFNSLDPQSSTISFKVEINTDSDIQNALMRDSFTQVMDPHMYIVSLLIDALRESHFILGKDIKLDSLRVDKKQLKSGGEIESSSFNYNVPIQKSVDREIWDFVYNQ